MNSNSAVLQQLMQIIEQRRDEKSEKSYTAKLLAGGVPAIAAKIREEANEVIEAADETGDAGREHFVHEAADLLYHLFVMLACRHVTLSDVEAELQKRFGMSGLDEKASRGK